MMEWLLNVIISEYYKSAILDFWISVKPSKFDLKVIKTNKRA